MGFEVYPQMKGAEQDEPTGEYGWRLEEEDNEAKIAIGGEGFTTEDHAERAIRTVCAKVYEEMWPAEQTEGLAEAAAARVPITRLDVGGDPVAR